MFIIISCDQVSSHQTDTVHMNTDCKLNKVKPILFSQLQEHNTYTWGTRTLLDLFVPSLDDTC